MKRYMFNCLPLLLLLTLPGCQGDSQRTSTTSGKKGGTQGASLVEARKGFQSKLVRRSNSKDPVENPPENVFQLVRYDSAVGKLPAYLTPDPKDGKKHPAIIWITGGDSNTIDNVWNPAAEHNDQTAAAYRKAGLVMMFPSLRGGNDNPGQRESFLGEVDDVIAAHQFLAKQSYVDPSRIYLGGHSTGGTLVMLVAACTDKFRGVFSFGPASDVSGYGPEYLHFDYADKKEVELRSPGRWVASIQCPTFVFEGHLNGNVEDLLAMQGDNKNPKVQFFTVRGANHFSVLGKTNKHIAEKILRDEGPTCNLTFTAAEVSKLFGK